MTAYKRPVFFDRDIKSFSELSADSGLDLGVVARSILADAYLQVGTTGSAGAVSVKDENDAEGIKLEAAGGFNNLWSVATIGGSRVGRVTVKNDQNAEKIVLDAQYGTIVANDAGADASLNMRPGQLYFENPLAGWQSVNISGGTSGGDVSVFAPQAEPFFTAAGAERQVKIGKNWGDPASTPDSTLVLLNPVVGPAITLSTTGSITLSAATSKITGLVLSEITGGTDAASKAYVDSIAQGLNIKGACHVSSQGNIEVLATTTEVDGHTLSEGERVLVRYQANAVENGIYRFDGTGLVRSADMADGSHAAGAFTFVQFGTNADQGWVCTADAPADVVGTDALPWTQFSAAGVIEAGDGLQLIGTVMSAKLDGPTLSASAAGLKVLGLPEMFEIGGVAVSATVTAPALDTLTAGFASDARLLHAHSCSRNTLPTATPTLASKAVVVDSSGQAVAAGTSSAGAWVVGYCTQVIDENAYVIRSGIADDTLVGATPGDVYYVQADGTIGTALPSEGRVIMIGVAISEFDLFVQIRDFGSILAA